jgi:hypothetical protein
MSKMIFAEAKEPKLEKVLASKPLTTNHNDLMITIAVTMAFSLLIGVGFAYIGYSSGHYSISYADCKGNILANERMGAYQSVGEITTALESCEGVTS